MRGWRRFRRLDGVFDLNVLSGGGYFFSKWVFRVGFLLIVLFCLFVLNFYGWDCRSYL